MTRTQHLAWALPALLLAAACSDSDGENVGNGGRADASVGTPDATIDRPDASSSQPDAGPTECRIDQECPSGQVCNLITKECVDGKSCTTDDDCDACSTIPIGDSEECGHGLHAIAYCDPFHGGVCTRSRASCEPCEEDRDCGRITLGSFADFPMYCIDYSEVSPSLSGKFCARPASIGAGIKGYEQRPLATDQFGRTVNVYVNPLGCPADVNELFICPIIDNLPEPDGDGIAEATDDEKCLGQESACVDDPCPGTGGQQCASANLAGVVPICNTYCTTSADCLRDSPARPFCNENTGVCQTGCTPGSCPNEQVCHLRTDEDGNSLNAECGPPCNEELLLRPSVPEEAALIAEADAFCTDPENGYGPNTYCNIVNQPRTLESEDNAGKLSKTYRDANACAPVGCELGEGEQINRDCGSQEYCDISSRRPSDNLPQPACAPGCFSSDDCIPEQRCLNDDECPRRQPNCNPNPNDPTGPGVCQGNPLDNPQVFRCVDAPEGQVKDDLDACRQAWFTNGLTEENRDSERPVPGVCCESGCIERDKHCVGSAQYCCNELGSPYEDEDTCERLEAGNEDLPFATAGQCFDIPVQPFCVTCQRNADCNRDVIEGLTDDPDFPPSLPFDPATLWPESQNRDCEGCSDVELEDYEALGGQINGGQPFTEFQRCIGLTPPMTPPYAACSISYDPKTVNDAGNPLAAGVPRGWDCGGRSARCTTDADCNGLTCVGFIQVGMMVLSEGACKCGEDGVQTAACPDTLNDRLVGEITAPTRMRCVEARTTNYQGPQSTDVDDGDMFCVHTFDCTPPGLQFPEEGRVPQTLPDACGIPDFWKADF